MLYYISNAFGGQKSANKNELIAQNNDFGSLKNVQFSVFGVVNKRPSMEQLGTAWISTTADCKGLHSFSKYGSSTNKLLMALNAKIYHLAGVNTAGTWTDSGATFNSGSTAVRFANFINRVFYVDGVAAVKDWDGATSYDAYVASAPIASLITVFGDRLYTNVVANKSRVFYSSIPVANEIVWTGGDSGYYDVQSDDGDVITAIHPRRDRLLIFKNNYIEGRDTNFRRISVVRGIGTSNPDTVQTIANETYFLNVGNISETGIWRYGTTEPVKISGPIQDLFTNVNLSECFSGVFEDNYIIYLDKTDSTESLIACYNTTNQVWTHWTLPIPEVLAFSNFINTSNKELLSVASANGSVYYFNQSATRKDTRYNSGTSATVVIGNVVSEIITSKIHCNVPHLYKEFLNIYLFDNYPIDSSVYYRIDEGKWEFAGVIDKKVTELPISGKGYIIEVKILDESFMEYQFKALAVEYELEEETR